MFKSKTPRTLATTEDNGKLKKLNNKSFSGVKHDGTSHLDENLIVKDTNISSSQVFKSKVQRSFSKNETYQHAQMPLDDNEEN